MKIIAWTDIIIFIKIALPILIIFFLGCIFGWIARTIKAEIEMDKILSQIKNMEDKWKI